MSLDPLEEQDTLDSWAISLSISYSAGMVVMNYFSLQMSLFLPQCQEMALLDAAILIGRCALSACHISIAF